MAAGRTVTVQILAAPGHLAALRELAAEISVSLRKVALAIALYENVIADLKVAEPIETTPDS